MNIILLIIPSMFFSEHLRTVSGARSCTKINPSHGRSVLKYRGRMAKFSCDPGYVLNGDKWATCIDGKWDEVPRCVRKMQCSVSDAKLNNGEVTLIKQRSIVKLDCDPGYKLVGSPPTMPCSDYRLVASQAKCEPDVQLTCDFENGTICGWINDTETGYTWLLHQNATPSHALNTGPSEDHTFQNGHYLYIETSGMVPDSSTRVARIHSPLFPPIESPDMCFVFWYHMYGYTMGTLNVYLDNALVFTKSGNLGDRWKKGVIQNLPSDRMFQITIEGRPGNGYAGDMAVDDIGIINSTDCTHKYLIETTCRGRCFETTVNSSLCQCSPECIMESSCCSDFTRFCSLEPKTSTEATTELSKLDSATTTDFSSSWEPTDFKTLGLAGMSSSKEQTDDLDSTTTVHSNIEYTPETETNGFDTVESSTFAITEQPTDSTYVSNEATYETLQDTSEPSHKPTQSPTTTYDTIAPQTSSNYPAKHQSSKATPSQKPSHWTSQPTHATANVTTRIVQEQTRKIGTTRTTTTTSSRAYEPTKVTATATPAPKQTSPTTYKPLELTTLQKLTKQTSSPTNTTAKATTRIIHEQTVSSTSKSEILTLPISRKAYEPKKVTTIQTASRQTSKETSPATYTPLKLTTQKPPKQTLPPTTAKVTIGHNEQTTSTPPKMVTIKGTSPQVADEQTHYSTEPDVEPSTIESYFPHMTNVTPWKSKYSKKGRYSYSAMKREESGDVATYFWIVLGMSLGLAVFFIAVWHCRRRRLRQAVTEENDVLFSTSDEALNFQLATNPDHRHR